MNCTVTPHHIISECWLMLAPIAGRLYGRKMTTQAKKAYQQALAEFRDKYFKEMKKNLDVLIKIRDDSKAKAKDRNEAVKIISRMLGTLTPDKIVQKPPDKKQEKEPELSEALKADLDRKYGL